VNAWLETYENIEAVTFDFYNTLVYPRAGRGRGVMLMEYLQRAGLESDPWEHQILYDIFEPHAREYSPAQSGEPGKRHRDRFAQLVFDRLNVRVSGRAAADHAAELWRIGASTWRWSPIGNAGWRISARISGSATCWTT
jgi:hypothetical protein